MYNFKFWVITVRKTVEDLNPLYVFYWILKEFWCKLMFKKWYVWDNSQCEKIIIEAATDLLLNVFKKDHVNYHQISW